MNNQYIHQITCTTSSHQHEYFYCFVNKIQSHQILFKIEKSIAVLPFLLLFEQCAIHTQKYIRNTTLENFTSNWETTNKKNINS